MRRKLLSDLRRLLGRNNKRQPYKRTLCTRRPNRAAGGGGYEADGGVNTSGVGEGVSGGVGGEEKLIFNKTFGKIFQNLFW